MGQKVNPIGMRLQVNQGPEDKAEDAMLRYLRRTQCLNVRASIHRDFCQAVGFA